MGLQQNAALAESAHCGGAQATIDPVFPRIVAGIDFSPTSLAACRWAIEYVAQDAAAMLAHVVPYFRESDDSFNSLDSRESADSLESFGHSLDARTAHDSARTLRGMTPALTGGLGGFAATLHVASARTVVRVGRPSHWLGVLAAQFHASLVVVGRRSDANRRRIGEANVVQRLARRVAAPVLVVPEGVTTVPRCVIAAVDQGSGDAEIVRTAAAVAAAHGYPLTVVHVLPPRSGTYDRVISGAGRLRAAQARPTYDVRRSDLRRPNHDGLRAPHWFNELAERPDVPTCTRNQLAVGDPAREIVAAGVAYGAGLIVVGKRGADGSPVGSIGSVARDLLSNSPLPVLAVDARG